METTSADSRIGTAQMFVGEFGGELGLACMLWDISVKDGPRAVSIFFNAVEQNEPYEPTLAALECMKASFTFRGMHQRATQCQQMIFGLHSLWSLHGSEELFGFWLRQSWSSELRRKPEICSALGVPFIHGEVEEQHPPLWELRADLVRSYYKPIYRMMSKRAYLDDRRLADQYAQGLQGARRASRR